MKTIYYTLVSMLLMTLIVLPGCGAVEPLDITVSEDGMADVSGVEVDSPGYGSSSDADISETLVVYVCGAVNDVGMYELKCGARIGDAIEAAGGMRDDADVDSINLAECVEDGSKIMVPVIGADADKEQAFVKQEVDDGKVNINTASKDELMSIPGIGEARADAIIDYRDGQGGFKSIEDIMKISGIKDAMFSRIKEYIKV